MHYFSSYRMYVTSSLTLGAAIVGGSVAGVVLLTIVVGVLSLCAATRKGKSGRGSQQKTTPTTHPYYRMPMGGPHNNTAENHYNRLQREEQPESNASYSVIYRHDSEAGELSEGSARITDSNGRHNSRPTDVGDEIGSSVVSDREALYTQPQKKKKVAITTQDSRTASSTEPPQSTSDQDSTTWDTDEDSLFSHPPRSLFKILKTVKSSPLDQPIHIAITPSDSVLPPPKEQSGH